MGSNLGELEFDSLFANNSYGLNVKGHRKP